MPFQSEEQKKYMYAKHPEIAKKWSAETKAEQKEDMKPGYKEEKKHPSKEDEMADMEMAKAKLKEKARKVYQKNKKG